MFILTFIPSDLKYWSANCTSIYENSESKVFKKLKRFLKTLGEISNKWSNDLLGTNVYMTLKSFW